MKSGDVVQLKSGGPEMTIQRLVGDSISMQQKMVDDGYRHLGFVNGDAICQWFEKKIIKTSAFPIKSLELLKD